MLQGCIEATNNRDPEAFATAVAEYDQIKRLDNWATNTLLVAKKLIEGDDEDIC